VPIHRPAPRDDVPNLLFSAADQRIVDELIERNGIVNIELDPGDVSIHHPNVLHWSTANTSAKRRCGLDIGYISTSTRILADGVYLDPLLARGRARPGVNNYRPVPEYREGDSIPFRGADTWNERVWALNAANGLAATEQQRAGATPVEAAIHMVSRLRSGTTTR
jgi:phytanoyl-CoA hydroxylase